MAIDGPHAGPTTASPARSSPTSAIVRLLIAFALGLPAPLFFSLASTAGPFWVQPAIVTTLLAAASVLSIWLTPRVKRGGSVPGRAVVTTMILLILIALIGAAYIAVQAQVQAMAATYQTQVAPSVQSTAAGLSILGAALVPLLVGLVTAFVSQRAPRAGIAIAGAALGWLAASIADVVAEYLTVYAPGSQSPEPSTSVAIAIAASIVGFGIAFVGGVLGWGVRAVLLRDAS